jgi:hypothetical protein
MFRERALRSVLVLVGLLFTAAIPQGVACSSSRTRFSAHMREFDRTRAERQGVVCQNAIRPEGFCD